MNEAENRKLAEFAGFRYAQAVAEDEPPQWHHPDCKCAAKLPDDACNCVDGCYWGEDGQAPDFYNDEAANALLLEKARFTILPQRDYWQVGTSWMNGTVLCFASDSACDADRKTAICAAALQRIERGEK